MLSRPFVCALPTAREPFASCREDTSLGFVQDLRFAQDVTLEITTCTKSSFGYRECGSSEYGAQSESSDGLKQLGYGARSAMNKDAGVLRQLRPLEVP